MLLMLSVFMVIGGSCATIFGKLMGQEILMDSGELVAFKHPLVMNLLMFLGEALLLIVYKMMQLKDPRIAELQSALEMNPCWFMLPATLDVCGSFLNFTGLLVITASSYQILKMLSMVFVVLISILVFRRRYGLQQWIAIFLVIIGLGIVVLVSVGSQTSEDDE